MELVGQKQEMITKWLEYDTEASWGKLANALKEMEKHVAATQIWNTHVTGYRGMFYVAMQPSTG